MTEPFATTTPDRVDEIRANLARRRVLIYEIAPIVRLNPLALGAILNGRRPLTPQMAEKIEAAIDEVARGRQRR